MFRHEYGRAHAHMHTTSATVALFSVVSESGIESQHQQEEGLLPIPTNLHLAMPTGYYEEICNMLQVA